MPSFTSFLNLYKPGGGSSGLITPDEVADVDRFNANSDLIDAWAVKVGNETTRSFLYYGTTAAMGGALVPAPKDGDEYQESDGNKTRWKRVGGVWVTNETGLYLIRPAAANVVNGTVTADGTILATAGTAQVSLNNVLTSRFRKYRLDFFTRLGTAGGLYFQLRAGGANNATLNYHHVSMEVVGSSINGATISSQPYWYFGARDPAQDLWGSLDLTNPAQSGTDVLKTYRSECNGAIGGTQSAATRGGYLAGADATTYDGFSVTTSIGVFQAPTYFKLYALA